MKHIAAVILAAGASTRYGAPKQLLDWEGTPLLAHIADVALLAELTPVIVVLGCQAEAARTALGSRPVRIAMNWRWKEGMSTSIQIGLATLPPQTRAAIFLQCDQPLVTPALLQELTSRFQETEASIVHPVHSGKRSTPVLFSRRLFSELAAVTGDRGGRDLITRHAEKVATVEVNTPHVLADIDTPQDYERLVNIAEPTSGTEPCNLQSIRHLIIDMDGVLWRGDEPMPDLVNFFTFLRQNDIDFILATNNSSRMPEQYTEKLAGFGVQVSPRCILTSSQATAAYLAQRTSRGTRVYAIGEEGLQRALEDKGFVLAKEEAAYVVVGWDRHLTWNKLASAALLIHDGAGFIGTNPDRNYPTERGPVPGNGAQLTLLEATTGVSPVVVGKPKPWMYQEAMHRMDATPQTTAVIGDRLDTDIAGGVQAGLVTVLVLSGIATASDLVTSTVRPDLVCADIEKLRLIWMKQQRG